MNWLIIVFLLMLVISPVMWLKPSPRQKRVARLREAAIRAGIKVRQEKPPLYKPLGQMTSYRWRYPSAQPGPRFVLVRSAEASEALKEYRPGWRWRIEPLRRLPDEVERRLETLLSRLPHDALVIESDQDALTLWWYESQSADRFASYLDDFERLRQGLTGRPDTPNSYARH
ncbi:MULTISPECIES: preprotein translocase subunit YajC [Halomonadaceae]|uniref:preprotein translocase subunit YajC n=1 Tax=Halomonadaceae TaxID=28256 RepID=UPI00159B732C|nr:MULTISPECIES: preprotein translocase subunit YajC [Halomonas]QJQ93982.1 preprotein translocase subunit YajC [Halomonas sp. PA5]